MFKKVMVAEDIESINKGVAIALEKLGIAAEDVFHASYCDQAYLKAKKVCLEHYPFELLICDLSFKKDYRTTKLTSGEELIFALKKEQPNLKIIVYSIEDHPQTVKSLWDTCLIDGYVCKDRKGLTELEEAIKSVYNGNAYLSPQIETAINTKNVLTLKAYEVALLTHLSNGLTQDEIELRFKNEGITPNSKSTIEKRLKELREDFNATTNVQLIVILKDLRLL